MHICKKMNPPLSTILGHNNIFSSLAVKTSSANDILLQYRGRNFINQDSSFNHDMEFDILVNILQLS